MGHKFENYCKEYENIENYQKALADNFKGWCCHHRKGVYIPREELISLGMYYDRPASELIFLTRSEHKSLHKPSEEAKKKIAEANKGKKRSEETRKCVSESLKGHPVSEESRKKMSEARKGKYAGETHPMYGKHHTDEAKKKISEVSKGKHLSEEAKKKIGEAQKGNTNTKGMRWYNNGKINKVCYECPDGFVPGRIK